MKRWFIGIVSLCLGVSALPGRAWEASGAWPAVAKLALGETRPLSDAALASVQAGQETQSLSPELVKMLTDLGILNLVQGSLKAGPQQKSQTSDQQLTCIDKNCTALINGKLSHFTLK
jgi:hypothetical protein